MNSFDSQLISGDASKMVRKGQFAQLKSDERLMGRLKKSAHSREDSYLSLTSRAVLAETYDQLGTYALVGEYANSEVGGKQLERLASQLDSGGGEARSDEELALARVQLIMQSAIAEFRRAPKSDYPIKLLSRTIELIEGRSRTAPFNESIRTLCYFWRGRMWTAGFEFGKAKADFDRALVQIDDDLDVRAWGENKRAHWASDDQVAEGNYVLSTCHGFGLGHLYQLQGKLRESLHHLRVALPLSRGSADLHRRGYTHLLMGIALRSMGSPIDAQGQLDEADNHLKRAVDLFKEQEIRCDGKIPYVSPCHHLHMARAYHQLALAHYTMAEPSTPGAAQHLERAKELIEMAKGESEHETCNDYVDPILAYGILVVRSMVFRSLNSPLDARASAEAAIKMVEEKKITAWAKGGAYIAAGRALTDLGNQNDAEADRLYGEAEEKFKKAIDDEEVRDTDRAAAHLFLSRLYLRRKDIWRASAHFSHARPIVEKSQHGWLKNLCVSVETGDHEVGRYSLIFDLPALSASARAEGLPRWGYVMSEVTRRVQFQLVRLQFKEAGAFEMDRKLAPKELAEIIEKMGVSRATAYNWLAEESMQSIVERLTGEKRKKRGRPRRGRVNYGSDHVRS